MNNTYLFFSFSLANVLIPDETRLPLFEQILLDSLQFSHEELQPPQTAEVSIFQNQLAICMNRMVPFRRLNLYKKIRMVGPMMGIDYDWIKFKPKEGGHLRMIRKIRSINRPRADSSGCDSQSKGAIEDRDALMIEEGEDTFICEAKLNAITPLYPFGFESCKNEILSFELLKQT